AYVVNNPLALYDPDGQEDQGPGGGIVIDIILRHDPINSPKGEDEMTRTQTKELQRLQQRGKQIGIQINIFREGSSTAENGANSLRNSDVVLFGPHTGENNGVIIGVPT